MKSIRSVGVAPAAAGALGFVGEPVEFTYRLDSKPDRLISFCGQDGVRDFNGDPHEYLQRLDDAAAKKNGAHSERKH